MQPIFLLGYMGCGKSTLGRNVGAITGMQFIDLDNYIERRFHATVSQLFARHGEDGFRDIERRMLHEVAEFEDVIVACGGGTPCFFDNMDYMNSRGTTVWLTTSIDRLHSRLKRGRAKRPLIAGKSDEELLDFIQQALDQRMPHYSKALHTFEGDLLENSSEIGATASRFINQIIIPLAR